MKALYKDRRFQAVVAANVLSSIGSGITMLAIPLLLVASPDGNKLFGTIMLIMTVISFVATPYIGVLIDRTSRKQMLLTVELIGFITVMLFVIVGFMTDYSTIHYIILYGTGNLYYTFFYPTIFALNQEVFFKRCVSIIKQYYGNTRPAIEYACRGCSESSHYPVVASMDFNSRCSYVHSCIPFSIEYSI